MPSSEQHDQRRGRWVSRRQVLGAGAGCLCLLLKGVASAEEQKPPHPRALLAWGRRGKDNGEFSANVGLAIGKDDVIYTSEFRNQRVQKFTTEGKFLGAFPLQTNPGGLAVDLEGNVYVGFWNANKAAAYSRCPAPWRWGRSACCTSPTRATAGSRSSRRTASSSASSAAAAAGRAR